jgi:uncharacterized protein
MNLVKVGVVVAAVAAVSAFAGVGLPEGAQGLAAQDRQGITVTGTGKATTVPDQAGFWFGVETRRKTASEAVAANSLGMRKLIAALQNAGVREQDIQTAEVSLSPDYSKSGSDVIGYVATNSVSVTVKVGEAGSVVDAAVAAGADQVNGPTLTKTESESLYRNALRAAVDDARGRAEVLAHAAGVEVGAVISIEEGSSPEPYYDRATLASEPTPIEPGTQDLDATVTVTYAIS